MILFYFEVILQFCFSALTLPQFDTILRIYSFATAKYSIVSDSVLTYLHFRVEFWSIETSVLFAAHISDRSLSAQAVVQQIVFMAYLVVSAVGDAGNVLIGQKIGENKPTEAINVKNIIYAVISMFVAVIFILIVAFHSWLPYIFDVEKTAIPLTQHALLLAGVVNVFDGYHVVQASIGKAW
jgi:multidrug resistance protein, MATE family